MPSLLLHGYPDSPFAEKIRTVLGYKQLAYGSVEIPVIMPKPDLTALTGGYRRTPVLQSGADIYCDTALILERIEQEQPEPPIFRDDGGAVDRAAARWTDSGFFGCCVAIAFQPKAVAANPRFQDPKVVEAFLKDRAALAGGGPGLAVPFPRAQAIFRRHLAELDAQL
jgi:glutathione S-transferase